MDGGKRGGETAGEVQYNEALKFVGVTWLVCCVGFALLARRLRNGQRKKATLKSQA